MTSFRFNFSCIDAKDEKEGTDQNKETKFLECEEIIPDKQISTLEDIVIHAKMFTCDDVEIGHVAHSDKMFLSGNYNTNALELAEQVQSDLVAGKYEGGLKVWECTSDLIKYSLDSNDIDFNEKKVLDLGCGVGILGIYALQNGAFVTFQDYNKEVIESVTIPSVLLNIDEELQKDELKKCKFYSGDWASFNKKLPVGEVYDIILTSETIYNEENYTKLIELFLERLSKDGNIYVAAKTCYFGVGGGMRQFESQIEKTGCLISESVWKSSSGVQREIIKVKRK